MSIVVKPYTFSAGAVIIASQHNSDYDVLYSDYNGNIDNTNIAANAGILASKLNQAIAGAIGSTTPNTGKFSTLETTGTFKVGTTNQGDILYDNGTSFVRLTPGTNGNFLQTQGASANPQWAAVVTKNQTFVSSGTFTSPITGVVFVTLVGGGGQGAGSNGNRGGGGSSGGWAFQVPFAVTATTAYTVTIGAGGTTGTSTTNGQAGGATSFSTLSVPGGNGGVLVGVAGASVATTGTGGAGGSPAGGTGGVAVVSGTAGGGSATSAGGGGGGTPFGTGGAGGANANDSTAIGNPGVGYGTGGGGGGSFSASNNIGGAGGNGIMFVQW